MENNTDIVKSDIKEVLNLDLPWEHFKDKTFLVIGATGLIGSFLVSVLLDANSKYSLNCRVYAIGRNEKYAFQKLKTYWENQFFNFIELDINDAKGMDKLNSINPDYIIDLASNTHPLQYASDPIGTITTNIIGLNNILEYATTVAPEKIVFASSNEIYGENRGDVELFDEEYCGYINCNTLRAGYPESKRCCEALCQAYISQKSLDIVIARLTRSFGPTMKLDDSKAINQFIMNGINGKSIVLKSNGEQYYSYTYVADAVSGLLYLIFYGQKGEAYNIADESCDIKLKDLAAIIANQVGKEVIFDLPSKLEAQGFSVVYKARLNGDKIKELGWKPLYSISKGIGNTIYHLMKF